jgi:DNA-directed RNA polymerase specialized sigma subunit
MINMGRAVNKTTEAIDREAVMIEFAPLIKGSIALIQEHSKIPLDREDLIAAALTGLFEAMDHYNPASHRNFRSFAELNIRYSLQQEIKAAADFFRHVTIQPVGPAEATRHMPKLTHGFDWKGHKHNIH